MGTSRRHHYIPKFYLDGFTNGKTYYLFDKKTEKINISSPINSYNERDRNAGYIKDEKSVLLEDMYSFMEGQVSPHFELIRNAKNLSELNEDILHSLQRFIAFMYWRVPQHDEEVEELINKMTFEDIGIDLVDKQGKSGLITELETQFKSVDLFRKMYRLFLPILSLRKPFNRTIFENWRFYDRPNVNQFISDNPVVIKEFKDHGSLTEEFIFPISGNKFIVSTFFNKPVSLPPIFAMKFDMLLLQQASRFVSCNSKQYLEILINDLYSFSKNHDFKSEMTQSLFSFFK
jgi:Protein of unknown function (DUF4238)